MSYVKQFLGKFAVGVVKDCLTMNIPAFYRVKVGIDEESETSSVIATHCTFGKMKL
jgi:hypothetical protein